MNFKLWLQNENMLAGPGGGPDWSPTDLVRYHKDSASIEAGAFYQGGGDPPKNSTKSPTAEFLSPKHRKNMQKRMKIK
jgi:hypothetical protein